MVFHIANYLYLPLWWAAWNAIMYWQVLEMHNRWGPHKVTQNYWVVSFIRKIPLDERWREVPLTLRHWTLPMDAYAPFTYRGLVELLLRAKHHIDHLEFTLL